jgi:peptidoglycan/xylan/chitin deacetylase (PgdA/CDA1 family)
MRTGNVGLRGRLRRIGRPVIRLVRTMRRRGELAEALQTIRLARDRRLVLIFHRVVPREAPRYEVVPTVPHDVFRQHLTALGELAQVVPLDRLLTESPGRGQPLRVALTFDDDYAAHVQYVLPILRELGLHGTFFLSGRALHGLGAYWFERLEALVRERGLTATARLLDLPDVAEEARLPLRCEGDARRQELIDRHAPPGDAPLDAAGIRELAAAGMGIGFHTVHHAVLPLLDDGALCEALTYGRDRLASEIGRAIEWFSYPHGKADERTVAFTRRAGYSHAWTTQPRLLGAQDYRYRHGRWEPLPVPTDDMLISLARFLQRASA